METDEALGPTGNRMLDARTKSAAVGRRTAPTWQFRFLAEPSLRTRHGPQLSRTLRAGSCVARIVGCVPKHTPEPQRRPIEP